MHSLGGRASNLQERRSRYSTQSGTRADIAAPAQKSQPAAGLQANRAAYSRTLLFQAFSKREAKAMSASVSGEALRRWCERQLGGSPRKLLFQSGHLSAVIGVELHDDRLVVVKVRPPSVRIASCLVVQRHLRLAGFPCPEPLAGPSPLGTKIATAEEYVPGGEQLPRGGDTPRRFAESLATSLRLAPPLASVGPLAPPPPWAAWDHRQAGVWPLPDDLDLDLNGMRDEPWLDEVAARAQARLGRTSLPEIPGHADWESQNIRWLDDELHVVHDWDSVAARPEAALAGLASAVFTANGEPASDATVAESNSFLSAYVQATRRRWSTEESEVAWAAGLWVLAFNAKKRVGRGIVAPEPLGLTPEEAYERLSRAGA